MVTYKLEASFTDKKGTYFWTKDIDAYLDEHNSKLKKLLYD